MTFTPAQIKDILRCCMVKCNCDECPAQDYPADECCSYVSQAIADMLNDPQWVSVKEDSLWISVKDQLPEDNTQVLVCKELKNKSRTLAFGSCIREYMGYGDMEPHPYWVTGGGNNNVIYWMPLPEIPEGWGAMTYPVIDPVATGAHLKQLMRGKGISGRALAKEMAVAPKSIYRWAKGKRMPTVDNLVILADILGCTVDDLIVRKTQ